MKKEETEELIKYIINPENNPEKDRFAFKRIMSYMETHSNEYGTNTSFPCRVLWKITGICNCTCKHCWANLGHVTSSENLMKIAKELADNHIIMVSLSGGEPLLCKDLFSIYKELKTNNAIVEILTNGSLITDGWIKEYLSVADTTTDVIQISLDGPNSKIHDLQRNTKIFDNVVSAIQRLKDNGIKVRISFTATKNNQNYIYDTYLLAQSLGVDVMSISPVFPLRKGKEIVNLLDEEVYLSQLLKCFRKRSNTNTQIRAQVGFGFQNKALRYYNEKELEKDIKIIRDKSMCYYMQETNISMQIDAFGEALPGPEYENEHSAGNVYESSISEIWREGKNWNEFRKGRMLDNTKCKNCKIFSICGGGNAKIAFDKYGTINAPDGRCI